LAFCREQLSYRSNNVNKKVIGIKKKLEKQLGSKALGYEEILDFAWGFLSALLCEEIINRAEYNTLMKVYSNYKNADSHWFINKDGELEVDPEGKITDDNY
jgi:hypothetical protein